MQRLQFNCLEPQFHVNNSDSFSSYHTQNTVSFAKANFLMLFREIIAIYCVYPTEHINTLCGSAADDMCLLQCFKWLISVENFHHLSVNTCYVHSMYDFIYVCLYVSVIKLICKSISKYPLNDLCLSYYFYININSIQLST